ncbi:hypothetical protein GmHk_09G025369 [Glycine max]|nr:hypothetical protein GmHk_09G025369 [Glycine max]
MPFNHPYGMILDEIQALVAAYIFGVNKDNSIDGDKKIVSTTYSINANRQTLRKLMLKGLLDQEILSLVHFHLTRLRWGTTVENVLGFYEENYMGKFDHLAKIFIPINDMTFHLEEIRSC